MHPHDQNVLVVRAIENHHLAVAWRVAVRTPEKVVGHFLLGRLLEWKNECPLRIEAGEEMPDGAVLSGGVETLQHDEQRLPGVGIEQILQPLHARDLLGCLVGGRLVRFDPSRKSRVDFA
jgi:hypothetical protein